MHTARELADSVVVVRQEEQHRYAVLLEVGDDKPLWLGSQREERMAEAVRSSAAYHLEGLIALVARQVLRGELEVPSTLG
jgi:hypothetical protein